MIYVFEDYALDTDRRELRRGTERVAVEPQVFDFLQYLISNRDRVVSKDDLIATVWGGRLVSESAISSRITAVRHAVGDSGEEQRLIRTIARKGLRFVGEVREEQRSGVAGPATPGGNGPTSLELARDTPANHRPGVSSARNLTILVAFCLLVAALALGAANREQLVKSTALKWIARGKVPSNSLRITVAVLPFTTSVADHASGPPIAQRTNDELRGYLSRISVLGVLSREAAREIETALSSPNPTRSKADLRYTVSGNVQAEDDKLRLSVDLIDVSTQLQVWSKRFEYTVAEWPLRQDDIARQLAYAVHVETVRREGTGLPDRIAGLSDSQLLGSGWATLMGWGALRIEHAGLVFSEALRRDPECTSAMVGLAGAKLLAASNLMGGRLPQMAEAG